MHALAAVEPLTPGIFTAVAVVVLVQVTMALARRTSPWRGRRGRKAASQATPRSQPATSRPSLTAPVAGAHSRWTSPGFWRRMDADLAPLSPADRDRLLEERISGLSELRSRLGGPSG